MSYLDEILKEREECTPEQGYNIVEIDDWAPIGEKLTIVKYVKTLAECLSYIQTTGQELYYYGKRDAVDHIESEQYLATGSKVDSQPSMHGEEGWVGSKSVPEWQYEPETRKPFVRETEEDIEADKKRRDKWLKLIAAWLALLSTVDLEKILSQPELALHARYVYTGHESPEICEGFHGRTFNLLETINRPVPPSEGLGYTNTHPNCKCYWEFDVEMASPKKLNRDEKSHINEVHRHIEQSAKDHTLHTVHTDGTLSNKTRGTNPMKEIQIIRETLDNLHRSFNWMTPDYLSRIKSISPQVGGRFMLIRASAETITDHRSEGEPLRRLLAGDEIHAFGRTGIGKGSDINHLGTAFQTGGTVMDAEYDPVKRELQFLHHEKDPEIIRAIQVGDIGEVSINAGTPRTMTVEVCDPVTGERCVTPRGLILGELDNIAFTYVVSSPVGMMWRGQVIPKAKAGVRNTAIELL